jgi:response regulator of citrate/malate metabolism
METEITEDQLQQFLDEGLSQNEIARRTGIPRSTLRRRLKTLGTPQVNIGIPDRGAPDVYKSTQYLISPPRPGDELQEMLVWWRERKRALQTESDIEQETQRQTYHVQKRYIAAIKRASDLERVSITGEIVNRAFAQVFEQYFPEK